MRRFVLLTALLSTLAAIAGAASARAADRTFDGNGNNVAHPAWGQAGTQYLRVAPPNYADGISRMVPGPSPRYVSNRIFNDVGQKGRLRLTHTHRQHFGAVKRHVQTRQ